MSKTTVEIPYTEIVERVMSLGRINSNAIDKVRGIVNDIYCRDIPVKHDWQFLIASSSITTYGEYKTGNASTVTDSRIVTFSTDAVLVDSMNGRVIKFAGNDVVYQITSFISATSIPKATSFSSSVTSICHLLKAIMTLDIKLP